MGTDPVIGSGEWYRTRSPEHLRSIIDESMPGPHRDAAVAELEKREAEEPARQQRRLAKRTFWVSVATLAAAVAGVVATLLH